MLRGATPRIDGGERPHDCLKAGKDPTITFRLFWPGGPDQPRTSIRRPCSSRGSSLGRRPR